MIKLSVVTPTHNPRPELLSRVLDALKRQTLSLDQWEYVLVDNASKVPLKGVYNLSWHPNGHIVDEPQLGLTPARLRGLDLSKGSIIVFVDDDCVLPPNYLEKAITMMNDYPHIGVWGAYIEGEFLAPIEDWMKPFAIMLCAMQFSPDRKVDVQYALARQPGPWIPAGAGMVMRKNVTDAYELSVRNDPYRLSLDRTGTNLIGSGDADIVATAIDMGLAVGNTMRLRVTHLIPESRLQLKYMLRLLYSSNYGTAKFSIHRGFREQKNPPRETMLTRLRKYIGSFVPKTPEQQCHIAFGKGYQDGICGLPFDDKYR